ncbi:hypothetical protein BAAM0499_07865 [Bifidobacterium animalis subsp. animalis MCC 0499]|uniref:hypothetical protein n=1 Tax=Bifidobacterium animalis TaxID=28025 RepID=UPI00069AADBA|nr:hypothetical protein [Bifidobacterium animalis]KOA59062.1 hypothetical protein BAAM0499_07865 [Bifidobacterium animalis subsp. animalis MCC 0499]
MLHLNEVPAWAWVLLAVVAAIIVMCAACELWKVGHRSVLLGRARAHASKGVRLSDEAAAQIHLHKWPWSTKIHVPREWLTDAEAAAFAGDVARIWHYNVLTVEPSRCWKTGWLQAMWKISLGKSAR